MVDAITRFQQWYERSFALYILNTFVTGFLAVTMYLNREPWIEGAQKVKNNAIPSSPPVEAMDLLIVVAGFMSIIVFHIFMFLFALWTIHRLLNVYKWLPYKRNAQARS